MIYERGLLYNLYCREIKFQTTDFEKYDLKNGSINISSFIKNAVLSIFAIFSILILFLFTHNIDSLNQTLCVQLSR